MIDAKIFALYIIQAQFKLVAKYFVIEGNILQLELL